MLARISRKQWFTLIVLLTMAMHYFYFSVPFQLNGYGRDMAEWPLLGDMFVSFPLLYYLMFRPSLKDFLLKSVGLIALGFVFGSVIIPSASKVVWRGVENQWLPLALAEGALELVLLVFLVRKMKALTRMSGNVDEAMSGAIKGRFGGGLAPVFLFEARIWYYALFLRDGGKLRYAGEQHFSYDKNDGNVSNQFAMIMLVLFDLPLSHLLVHLVSSKPWVAWVADALTLWTLLYLVAEYRASHWRPVSLSRDAVLIRCGVFAADRVVPMGMVESVSRCGDEVRRQKGVLRFRQFGRVNVELRLKEGSRLADGFGRMRPASRICLSLDRPDAFIDAVRDKLAGYAR